ncbi:Aste57867_11817 [Aphanomyces stellatus]|uniref:Aste57867_11817 protein n=1 Tax=Aphanomyces stellatus TaxID=120398 RepID=A0A485KV61_9STRA|nr:hypothetical protein As57867_011772 [Aphanomyces stellatus]VFT88672.1 Aste57867_11817 [Aphanomyces stellatus]
MLQRHTRRHTAGPETIPAALHEQLSMRRRRHVFNLAFDDDTPLLNVTWMDNAESSMCVICHDSFHFMRRKHHCRLCGRLVCNACSRARASIRPHQLERTCELCSGVLQSLEALGDARVHSNTSSAILSLHSLASSSPEHDHARVMRVRQHLKQYKPPASAFYIVSAAWLHAWFLYTTRRGSHPGPIANHALLSFYQGKLHAKRDGEFRVVHELIWCALHELYGGGPIITTGPSTMAWSIQLDTAGDDDDNAARTLVHTHTRRKKSSALQCWFQLECNRLSLLSRSSAFVPTSHTHGGKDLAISAVEAFAAAANQARRDAEDRLSQTNVRASVMLRASRYSSAHHATI